MIANIIGIGCSVIWNYSINNLWTWKTADNGYINNSVKVVRWTIQETSDIKQLNCLNK